MPVSSKFARVVTVFALAALLAPQGSWARVEPSHGFDMFSAPDEVQVGKQNADEIRKQLPLLPDSDPVARYVQQLGARLAAHAPGEKWPYEFHVVNQKEINAFALPGGPVFVNLGTIQAADNEAQLAGVMAHEISHVVQRHGTRAATKQMMAQIPLSILGGMAGGGSLGRLAQAGISFGAGSYFLKNSRRAESEADLLGSDIMYDSGFDPNQMAVFFDKLKQQGGRNPGLQFLSDHPDPGNRAEAVAQEVRTLAAKRYVADSAEFRDVKQRAAGMHPLTAQQISAQQQQQHGGGNRIVGGGADMNPGEAMQRLSHNSFEIDYPGNWEAMGDQNSSVTIAPRSGVSSNAVAYGAMINGYAPENPDGSLDAATHELLASLREGNPELRQVGHDEDLSVNGLAAKSVDLVGNSPLQDQSGRAMPERDWLVTMKRRNGDLMYIVFIAPDSEFGRLRPTFEQMLYSLRVK